MYLFQHILTTSLLVVILSTLFPVQSKDAKAWSNKCGQGYLINQTNHAYISQNFDFDTEALCKWELIGNTDCEVEVACSLHLPSKPDGSCGSFALIITDGHGGIKKYCGKKSFESVRPSEGLRDLFLILHTKRNHPDIHDGISCTAKCINKNIQSSDNNTRLPKTLKDKTDSGCVCGLQNDQQNQRIVGGEDAKFNEFPWLAAIVHKGTREPFCGGALINDRFILTAAHCLGMNGETKAESMEVLLHAHVLDKSTQNKNGKDIQAAGDNLTRRTDADEKTLRFSVKQTISHPLFSIKYDFDFALLLLDKPVKFAVEDAPTPVCLPPPATFDSFKMEGKNLVVSGWGLSDENAKDSTRLLQKLDVPYISKEKCLEYLPKYLTDRMICFGYEDGTKDACSGDSGGPLVHQLPSKKWWQLGVVSFGIGCARAKQPGVYSKVTEASQWIHFHTAHHEAKWCSE